MTGLPPQSITLFPNPSSNNSQHLDFSKIIKPSSLNANMHVNNTAQAVTPIPIKPVQFLHGEPLKKWTESEVYRMYIIEEFQYAVICMFSYGWLELHEIHRMFPSQCGIKGECNVGFLRYRLVLIRLTLFEDFVNLTFKSAYYLMAKDGYQYQM